MGAHHIKIENIWSIDNNEYMIYVMDKETQSVLELVYQLDPIVHYWKKDQCVAIQYKCSKKQAKKWARVNNITITDGTLPKLQNIEEDEYVD